MQVDSLRNALEYSDVLVYVVGRHSSKGNVASGLHKIDICRYYSNFFSFPSHKHNKISKKDTLG